MAPGHDKQKTRKNQSNGPSGSKVKPGPFPSSDSKPSRVSLKLHQQCLDIFRDALNPSEGDAETLQEVKGHLYQRDFATAFGQKTYLRVYASRWSPSRALAYMDVFEAIRPHMNGVPNFNDSDEFSVLCLGGGAGGELVALAGWQSLGAQEDSDTSPTKLHIRLIDIADWTKVVEALRKRATTPPELSKYASQAKKDANKAMVDPRDISVTFQQLDVLKTDDTSSERIDKQLAESAMITFMFTLNELYSASMSETQQLLARITNTASSGLLLLVVDSPGSYSTVSLNGAEKKYPMKWLLDYTLLGPPNKEGTGSSIKWEKLIDDSSRWFRLPEELDYPIELENMRYQIHLYRRLDDAG